MQAQTDLPAIPTSLLSPENERPYHGGDILSFCNKHGYDPEDCVDLSTGIAPWSWPAPEIPQEIWQALPSAKAFEQDLLKFAALYYGCGEQYLLPVSGSQAAIENLPRIAKPGAELAYPYPGYEEHRYRWANAGFDVHGYQNIAALIELVDRTHIDHAVVINPNNPSTEVALPEQIEWLRKTLSKRGGFLVVDEAFADASPDISQIHQIEKDGLIILRSIGKFFGLGGLRLGFVAAQPAILEKLKTHLGLWSVHTAALWLGAKMLSDSDWISAQRQRISTGSAELMSQVQDKFPDLDWCRSELFVSGVGMECIAEKHIEELASTHVHSRSFPLDDDKVLLRLGLASEDALQRIKSL